MHIFEFFENTCIRRGSARAHVPLSAYGRTPSNAHVPLNATHVADHLIPLFEYAADVIPTEYHSTTGVKYQATAGMRLLDVDEQEAVYDALYTGLMESNTFVFDSTTRQDIATLSGDLEGFYGAVAANYLKGVIDIQLNTMDGDENHGPLGALDMGGSSTQIVYLPGTNPCENQEACHDEMELPSKLNGDDFFATSYLAYGVDQFRERLWDTWVERQQQQEQQYQDACGDKYIDNPCGFKGYELEWKGYTLIGTGDTAECVKQVQQLIPHDDKVHDSDDILPGNQVGGVEHPPLRGKFFAMSLYYFSLDSLRVLSHPHAEAHEALNLSWPTPSIEELFNALDGLCSRSWQGVSVCCQSLYTCFDVCSLVCCSFSLHQTGLGRDSARCS